MLIRSVTNVDTWSRSFKYIPFNSLQESCNTLFGNGNLASSTTGINIVFLTSNNICVGSGTEFEKNYPITSSTKYYIQYNSTLHPNLEYAYSSN